VGFGSRCLLPILTFDESPDSDLDPVLAPNRAAGFGFRVGLMLRLKERGNIQKVLRPAGG
jgi:hypothetical protein